MPSTSDAAAPVTEHRPRFSAPWATRWLLLACVLLLAPLWVVQYPALTDYPNHLARGHILMRLGDGSGLERYYAADWGPYPYLTTDVLLLGLMRVLPVALAGKVMLSICLLSVPLGAWLFLRKANPGQEWLAVWPLVIAYNAFFLYGFINFQLGLGLCFAVLGLWLGFLERPGAAGWVALLLAATVLYFTHLLGFAVAGFVLTAYGLLARRWRATVLSWLAFAPGVLLYLYSRMGAGRNPQLEFSGVLRKLLGAREALRGYSLPLDVLTFLLLAGCAVALLWRNRELRWERRWLGAALALLALYAAFPAAYAGGTAADVRLLLFLFVVALAAVRPGARGRQVAAVVLLVFGLRWGSVMYRFASVQPEMAAVARSFPAVAPGARVLPLIEHDENYSFLMAWAYGVIERGWYVPYIFHLKGVHPLELKLDTYRPDGFWGMRYPREPDWTRVQRDYDYVWAYDVARFDAALAGLGEQVFAEGKLRVYRLKRANP